MSDIRDMSNIKDMSNIRDITNINEIKHFEYKNTAITDSIYNYLFGKKKEKTEMDYNKYFEAKYEKIKKDKINKQLEMSKILNKYTDKNNIDEINKYFENDILDISNLNDIVSIPRKEFVNMVFTSYKKDTDIIKQFLIDFPRQEIYINNKRCSCVNSFLLQISKYNENIEIDNFKTSKLMFIIAMLCQSSFYTSYYEIHSKLIKMKTNIIDRYNIEWAKNNKIINSNMNNIYVLDGNKRNSINILIDENTLRINFTATFKLMDIETEIILAYITSETIFDRNNEECLILYESNL